MPFGSLGRTLVQLNTHGRVSVLQVQSDQVFHILQTPASHLTILFRLSVFFHQISALRKTQMIKGHYQESNPKKSQECLWSNYVEIKNYQKERQILTNIITNENRSALFFFFFFNPLAYTIKSSYSLENLVLPKPR